MRKITSIAPVRISYLLLLLICGITLADHSIELFDMALARIRYPYELNYTEGSILCQIQDLVGEASLYGKVGARPYTFTVYPPLYHAVTAALSTQIGDAVLAGRTLSFACALVLALVLAALIFRLGASAPALIRWAAAMITAVSFLATGPVVDAATSMRVDMLALTLAVCGLYLFLSSSSTGGKAVALVFFILALLAKHTAIAAPAACIFGSAMIRPRLALKLGLAFALLLGIAFGALGLIFGDAVYFHIFRANALSYRLLQAVKVVWRFNIQYSVLAVTGIGALIYFVWNMLMAQRTQAVCAKKWTLLVYCVIAGASLLGTGRVGTAANHLLEVTVALCLLSGLAVLWTGSYLWTRAPQSTWLLPTAFAMVLPTALVWQATQNTPPQRFSMPDYSPTSLWVRETLLDRIRATPGPVFGVTQFLVCRAGKPAQINTFMVAQLARIGVWDARLFRDDIRRKEFALVFLDFDLMGERYKGQRFTPEILDALRENYRPDERLGPYHLYRPVAVSALSTAAHALGEP